MDAIELNLKGFLRTNVADAEQKLNISYETTSTQSLNKSV